MNETSLPPGASVRHLQTMLRTVSFAHPHIPRLIPNGTFDEKTLEAVMVFQRDFFPPVTGQVDNATWDEVVRYYFEASNSLPPPQAIPGMADSAIAPGDESPCVMLFQTLCKALSPLVDGLKDVTVDGIHLSTSVDNARWVQRQGAREESGTVEQPDWDFLVGLYKTFCCAPTRE